MASKKGMDTARIRTTAGELDIRAGEFDGLCAELTGLLAAVDWTGDDATKFRANWESRRTEMLMAAQTLRGMANVLRSNAAKQESTSGH